MGVNRSPSRKGFRTLILARRRLLSEEYVHCTKAWAAACTAEHDRDARKAEAAAVFEKDLQYIGLTVLEDRLQDGVPRTIATIRAANIRFWVLTGDKAETAMEVAKSCLILDSTMHIQFVLGAQNSGDALKKLQTAINHISDDQPLGLVIDGYTLEQVLKDAAASRALQQLGMASTSCVACRLSPLQKKDVVQLMKSYDPQVVTLAIGDGANDVPMIQAAQVGIGVRGKEGTSAIRASDIIVSEFRFLGNLLFCHGRKYYRRIATYLLWYLYKQLLFLWPNVIHSLSQEHISSSCWPSTIQDLTDVIQELGCMAFLLMDTDLSDDEALRSPGLYLWGQQRKGYDLFVFSEWMAYATFHGCFIWITTTYLLTPWIERQDLAPEFWMASTCALTSCTIVIWLRLLIANRFHLSFRCVALVVILCCLYFVVLLLVDIAGLSKELEGGLVIKMLASSRHWLVITSVSLVAILPDILQAFATNNQRFRDTQNSSSPLISLQPTPLVEAGSSWVELSIFASGRSTRSPNLKNDALV